MNTKFVLGSWIILGFTLVGIRSASAADPVDYGGQIKPILEANCFKCHGAKKQESGLRLDSVNAAVQGGDSGPAIVPGKAAESRLIHAVSGVEDASPMPPRESGSRLRPDQIALLTTWIDQGTKAAEEADAMVRNIDHWSFKPRRHPSLPAVKHSDWVRNGIDAFVLANLEKQNLSPSPEADPATLIRRLYIDLLGLPPRPEEVRDFELQFSASRRPSVTASFSQGAEKVYEALVDRILTSPHYGERWGRHWLDLARYADTDGYEKDRPRPDAWRYRDWVIDSLNRDLPFDQFTIEQLAGDLLPNATPMQILATAFNRQTLTNTEGGADQEEFRVAATVDRVNTTGAVWLGLTLGCAQCHSHKYDPISQREYYQMFAFYNNADEVNADVPVSDAAVQKYQTDKARYEQQSAALAAEVAEQKKQLLATLPDWEAKWQEKLRAEAADPATFHDLEVASIKSEAGAEFEKQPDGSYLVTGTLGTAEEYTLEAETQLPGITGIRVELLADKSLPKRGPGREPKGMFVLGELRVYAAATGDIKPEHKVKLARVEADFADADAPAAAILDGDEKTGWSTNGQTGKNHTAVVFLDKPVAGEETGKLQIVLSQRLGKQRVIGRFRVSLMTGQKLNVPDAVRKAFAVAVDARTPQQLQTLLDYYFDEAPAATALRKRLAALNASAPKTPTMSVRVVAERTSKPRDTHVLRRGDFLQPSLKVEPNTLSALHPLKPRGDDRPDRLDLAHWLVDPDNPLTARVNVNRIWQQYFGRGLVNSPSDFGTQGERPSNADLLDWLASEWIARGWSLKALHKLIVTSSTYRQTSRVSPQLWQRDPYNVQLARQSRFRVEAEAIRDLTLAASGLLTPVVGGPSVRPRQPAGVSDLTYANSAKWVESTGTDRHRRGMYTWFQRTSPYPMLTTFDAPESILTCTRRERSNTPLQALTLLNDPVFFECAQSLGRRIVKETPAPESQSLLTEARLRYAFQLCVAREPSPGELADLTTLFTAQLELCQANSAEAAKLVGKQAPPEGVSVSELAAWIAVGRTLLNLDEFITRE